MRTPKLVAKLERSAGSLETQDLRPVPEVKAVLWTALNLWSLMLTPGTVRRGLNGWTFY